jgi:hypothetical protein
MLVHVSCRMLVPCVAMTLATACTIETSDGRDGGRDGRGSGGTVEDSGGSGSDAGTFIDDCGQPEVPPNNDRDHVTPIVLGSTVRACLQTYDDVDMYAFTVPPSPTPGGVVVAKFTNVGASGNVEARFQSVDDNGTFGDAYGLTGTNVTGWFAAIAGQKYRLQVTSFTSAMQTKYTLALSYVPVSDASEPNDTRQTAATIQPGTAVSGYFFSGFETSTKTKPTDNWYKVTLTAGMATIALTHVATNVEGDVALVGSDGVEISEKYDTAGGNDITLQSVVSAADYYVHVYDFGNLPTLGHDDAVPDNFDTAYTLNVSVK